MKALCNYASFDLPTRLEKVSQLLISASGAVRELSKTHRAGAAAATEGPTSASFTNRGKL